MSQIKLIKQLDSNDCGKAVVEMIINYYGYQFKYEEVNNILNFYSNGLSLKQVLNLFEIHNFEAKAIKISSKDLFSSYTLPAILMIENENKLNHYVVCYKVKKDVLYILDPIKGNYKIKKEEINKIFTGIMILAIPNDCYENFDKKTSGILEFFKSILLPNKKILIIVILYSFIITIISILSSTFSKIIIDEIIPNELSNKLFVTISFFILLTIIQVLLTAFRQHAILYLSRKIDIPVSLGYFNHILHLPYNFFINRKVGDILTRFSDSSTIKNITVSLSITLVLDVFLLVASSVFLISINYMLYIILLLEMICFIILIYCFKNPYKKLNYELMIMNSNINSYLIETFQNVETIKTYSTEKNSIFKLEKYFVELLEKNYDSGKLQNIQTSISNLLNGVFHIIMYGLGARYILNKQMSFGDLLLFQSLSLYFIQPVQNVTSLQLTFQEAKIALDRLNDLMSFKREDENSNGLKVEIKGNVEFNNVTFYYDERKNILDNITLKIKKGEKIAFTGTSGSGKSTIAKLMAGLIETKIGSIMIDGYNIKDLDINIIRRKIRYVSQNIVIFNGTVYDNLTYGSDDISIEKIYNVCKLVGLKEFVDNLPYGINTFIEENGRNLSVGEKQRISIARALLSDGEIYIFDEATSNLDEYNQKHFENLIKHYLKDKTVIIISHSKNIKEICEKIYRLENGKISLQEITINESIDYEINNGEITYE